MNLRFVLRWLKGAGLKVAVHPVHSPGSVQHLSFKKCTLCTWNGIACRQTVTD